MASNILSHNILGRALFSLCTYDIPTGIDAVFAPKVAKYVDVVDEAWKTI